jgi:hypothetical protein
MQSTVAELRRSCRHPSSSTNFGVYSQVESLWRAPAPAHSSAYLPPLMDCMDVGVPMFDTRDLCDPARKSDPGCPAAEGVFVVLASRRSTMSWKVGGTSVAVHCSTSSRC